MGAENVYIYIFIFTNRTKGGVFFFKISMITNVILILYNRSINNKLILRYLHFRHHIACFCSISPTKKLLQTATALFCVSEQHDGDSFLNDSIV